MLLRMLDATIHVLFKATPLSQVKGMLLDLDLYSDPGSDGLIHCVVFSESLAQYNKSSKYVETNFNMQICWVVSMGKQISSTYQVIKPNHIFGIFHMGETIKYFALCIQVYFWIIIT